MVDCLEVGCSVTYFKNCKGPAAFHKLPKDLKKQAVSCKDQAKATLSLANIFYPEIHDVDLWKILRKGKLPNP